MQKTIYFLPRKPYSTSWEILISIQFHAQIWLANQPWDCPRIWNHGNLRYSKIHHKWLVQTIKNEGVTIIVSHIKPFLGNAYPQAPSFHIPVRSSKFLQWDSRREDFVFGNLPGHRFQVAYRFRSPKSMFNNAQVYPLVMTHIAMEAHHFRWKNPLSMAIFNSYEKLLECKQPAHL